MPMSATAAVSLAQELAGAHAARWEPLRGPQGRVRRYLAGDHDEPFMPRSAKTEYRRLAERSRTPWLPLISDTFAKVLFVEGFRSARTSDNAAVWQHWQANKLDARQTIVHRGALEYGAAYGSVLPSDGPSPAIRFYHPSRTHVVYSDFEADWPDYALVEVGVSRQGERLWRLYDDVSEFELLTPAGEPGTMRLVTRNEHGLGRCPFVRYRERLGDPVAPGIIAPLIPLQDRINETVFSMMVAMQFAAFRQRWATGLAIPEDEDGNPVEPFEAAVDRLWISDSPDAKFGDFGQTEVAGHLEAYQSAVRSMAAVAQTSPHVLLGDLVNLSADALAAAEQATTRKADEYATIFGESHEQLLRFAGEVAGDAAVDDGAEVRWRDREARSLASVVDALGKMAEMLKVPPQALWDRIPGTTDTEVERWKQEATSTDSIALLAEAMTRQVASPMMGVPGGDGAGA
jgi:hypothetical protein